MYVKNIYDYPKSMENLTSEQISDFYATNSCHICEKPLKDKIRVRDHSYLKQKFRGAAPEMLFELSRFENYISCIS